jgi:hypothetical protein
MVLRVMTPCRIMFVPDVAEERAACVLRVTECGSWMLKWSYTACYPEDHRLNKAGCESCLAWGLPNAPFVVSMKQWDSAVYIGYRPFRNSALL